MAESLKDLRRRVRTVKSTQQITRAMEMVSASKLRRAQAVLMAGRPYAAKLQELLSHLGGSASVAEHPLFEQREGSNRIMVVFTGDRGLCGAFNNNLLRLVEKELRGQRDKQWQLYCIGKKGADYFQRREWPIIHTYQELGGRPEIGVAREISEDLHARFTSGQTDAIYFYYQAFVSLAVYRPTLAKFLNLEPGELAGENQEAAQGASPADYILEPSADEVFNSLLPRYLTSKVYITLAEVFTAEHSARMIAMNLATKNCKEISDALTLQLNKARQAGITSELLEIVGGAEAVKG